MLLACLKSRGMVLAKASCRKYKRRLLKHKTLGSSWIVVISEPRIHCLGRGAAAGGRNCKPCRRASEPSHDQLTREKERISQDHPGSSRIKFVKMTAISGANVSSTSSTRQWPRVFPQWQLYVIPRYLGQGKQRKAQGECLGDALVFGPMVFYAFLLLTWGCRYHQWSH